jgi:hypothetical protein
MESQAAVNLAHLMWVPEDEPGIEDVAMTHNAGGYQFSGTLIRLWEGGPLKATYELECDSQWRVRRLSMNATSNTGGTHGLMLLADGDGNWQDGESKTLTDLHGCIDVDLMFTPLTNTLPIQRLALVPGESREISVVYVSVPVVAIRPFRQRYTRLDDADGQRRYRYESLESGFTADLAVDSDGFVIDYPAIWRRVWPHG